MQTLRCLSVHFGIYGAKVNEKERLGKQDNSQLRDGNQETRGHSQATSLL